MMKFLYAGLFLLALTSCGAGDKTKTLYEEWIDKEIIFPSEMTFTVQMKDTVSFPLSMDSYKILLHVDSTGCTDCKLKQLGGWKDMEALTDSLVKDKVQFLYVFSPDRMNYVAYNLRVHDFNFPVCIDPQDSLGILNQFPEDENFHTFLLDKDNRVLAIGNPIYSTRIRDLYLNIIQGKATPPVASEEKEPNYTEISVPETEVDFGACDWQKEHTAVFKIRNTGQKLLVVHEVKTSCGCLEADYTKAPVKPGGEAEVRLTFKATQPGYFRKVALVRCNTEGQLLRLYVTGEAE